MTPWEQALRDQGFSQWPGAQNPQPGGYQGLQGLSGMSGLGQQLQQYQPSQGAGSPFAGGSTALGAMAQAQPMGAQGQRDGGMPFSLPAGGLYGHQKWDGTNDVDVFLPRGTPIRANIGGTVLQAVPGNGLQGRGYVQVRFDNGLFATFVHTQPTVQGRFAAGQNIGTINDDSMNMLRWPGGQFGQAPDGYQHTDIRLSMRGPVGGGPGNAGEINASQYLQQNGYQGRLVGRTPGPPEGMGGGFPGGGGGFPGMGGPPGMGGGFPGMGGPMGGMFGGGGPPGMGGFPGMGGGMGMPGMGGPPGMGMGFPGMGGGMMGGGMGMQRPPMMGFPMPMGGMGGGSMMGGMMGQLPFGGMGGIGPMAGGLGGFGFGR